MIITDKKIVQDTLDKIMDKCYLSIDNMDIQYLFGKYPQIRMIQVAADSINELIPLINQDFESIGGLPHKILVVHVIRKDMTISEFEPLYKITVSARLVQSSIIFEKSSYGRIMAYYFFL